MVGVDIDPDMVAFCAGANLPGRFETIANGQPLAFADGSFRLITAYSVFTHLPPQSPTAHREAETAKAHRG